MLFIHRAFEGLIHLVYPLVCANCHASLSHGEQIVCGNCLHQLPLTGFHLKENNVMKRSFDGKPEINRVAAFYFFKKEGAVQQLIHALKYSDKEHIGIQLGVLYGNELKKTKAFAGCDLILPVPLHKKKQKLRGYNQSALFAEGLSESMNISFRKDVLIRTKNTETQTDKTRDERIKNVENAFSIPVPDHVKNKKIILVDDVMTTGATLQSAAASLFNAGAQPVNLVTIAYAEQRFS